MSAHVLLNELNKLGKSYKMSVLHRILSPFAIHLMNLIKQEHKCLILFII